MLNVSINLEEYNKNSFCFLNEEKKKKREREKKKTIICHKRTTFS